MLNISSYNLVWTAQGNQSLYKTDHRPLNKEISLMRPESYANLRAKRYEFTEQFGIYLVSKIIVIVSPSQWTMSSP